MPNINLSFAQDPNTLALALIYGLVPAIAWLVFWLREKREREKGSGTLAYAFLIGAGMVIAALPVEQLLNTLSTNSNVLTIMFSSAEEVLKFGGFLIMLFAGSAIEQPVDYALYAAVIALGFAGFENALYFLQPLQTGNTAVLVLAGSMRFLGTTLMHSAAASLPGIALGLSFYKSRRFKQLAAAGGLVVAAALHSTFNIWISANGGVDFFQVFTCLWIAVILILLLYEKLRRMGSPEYAMGKRVDAVKGLERMLAAYTVKIGATSAEEKPFVALLAAKGIVPTSPEHAEFQAVLGQLRSAYVAYLMSEGAASADAERAVLTVIPDAVSPKAAEGIVTVLDTAARKQ